MDLRELANNEASAFIERLVAAAEARATKARADAEQQVAAMRADVDGIRAQLESETTRAAALEADLDAVIEAHRQVDSERIAAESAKNHEAMARAKAEDELRGVRELLERARAEAARVSEQLEDEGAQKALLQEEMQGLRDAVANLEKSSKNAAQTIAALERRVAELEGIEGSLRGELAETVKRHDAELRKVQSDAYSLTNERDAARGEVNALRAERDGLHTERDALRAEITDARAHTEGVRSEAEMLRADAEASHGRIAALQSELQAERDHVRAASDTLVTERDALRVENEALLAEAEALKTAADTARAEAQALRDEAEGMRHEMETARAEVELARGEADTLRVEARTLRGDVEALRSQSSGTSDEIATLQEMLDASREHHEKQVATARQLETRLQDAESRLLAVESTASSTLSSAITAIDALGSATTMSELFGTLVRELATVLPRVALFRVKGNHLEGEHGAGLDESVQMKKIVIPLNVDSVITRAASGGGLIRADGDELATSRPPFGGSPVAAIAVPLVFQGEALAVLYADSDQPTTNSHATFALLMVRHATVLLSRLTQELKALKELREYAVMLLQEAEQMFVADVDGGRPAKESIRRLRDTVDCGRQLYAQRAALEGTEAAGLFDEQVSIVINARASAFAEALAAATEDHQRVAS